ncbi:MAG TPA: hypothetical protein VM686_32315, partial [Polyangiaceae bacterium]|nr:hypothetical protein [Polyangiaceae bacterium]
MATHTLWIAPLALALIGCSSEPAPAGGGNSGGSAGEGAGGSAGAAGTAGLGGGGAGGGGTGGGGTGGGGTGGSSGSGGSTIGERSIVGTSGGTCALDAAGTIHCWGLSPAVWEVPDGSFVELYSSEAAVCAVR